jgi:hypothetical protein
VTVLVATSCVLLFFFVVATGAWRVCLRPALIDADTMTVERLGFKVSDAADIELVHGVCRAFAGGFNSSAAATGLQGSDAWTRHTDGLAVHFRPFADEGAAMGYPLRAMWNASAKGFEADFPQRRPAYGYLHYVGLGFWHAMRGSSPAKVERLVKELDPLHGRLCWDGYGFKFGFFDYDSSASRVGDLRGLPGYAAHVAHQGLGRSLWFRFMGDAVGLVKAIKATGDFAPDVASGVGLAVAFTTIDRSERGRDALESLPVAWRDDVLLGMCFALKARSLNDPAYFDACLEGMGAERAESIRRGLLECDARERTVRSEIAATVDRRELGLATAEVDGYRRWRESLKTWLGEHIVYPFDGMRDGSTALQDTKHAVVAVA